MAQEEHRVESTTLKTEKTPLCVVQRNATQRRRREAAWLLALTGFGVAWALSLVVIGVWHATRHVDVEAQGKIPAPDLPARCKSGNGTSRILIIRHCEKDASSRRNCNPKGYRRAAWLPNLFVGPDQRWQAPSVLIARAPEPKHYVRRSVETLHPLSDRIGVPINQNYSALTVDALISHLQEMVSFGSLCGGLALVCWKHEQIPHIVGALGYQPFDEDDHTKSGGWWKSKDFDTIVTLSYNFDVETGEFEVSGHLEKEGFKDKHGA